MELLQQTHMFIRYFFGTIGGNQKETGGFGIADKHLQEIQTGAVSPMDIINKEKQRMLLTEKQADKFKENKVETIPGYCWPELRDRLLTADDQFKLRDEFTYDLTVFS